MRARLFHEFRFEAAHQLPKVPIGHKCAQLHGHSYRVELAVAGAVDESTGWYIDFADIEAAWAPVHAQLDHCVLNEILTEEKPTSEVLARWIWARVAPKLAGLVRVIVAETNDSRCEYEGD